MVNLQDLNRNGHKMKTLYFIRHGQSEANVNYDVLKVKEDKDVLLTTQGKSDAVRAGRDMADHLSGVPREQILFVVSPYVRTLQTFERVFAVSGMRDPGQEVAFEVLEDIVEHKVNLLNNPGNWKKFKEYEQSGWQPSTHMDVEYEGGESLRDVQQRARQFLVDAAQADFDHIVVVSHGLFIKMALSLIDNVNPDNIVHPNNGEIIPRRIKADDETV